MTFYDKKNITRQSRHRICFLAAKQYNIFRNWLSSFVLRAILVGSQFLRLRATLNSEQDLWCRILEVKQKKNATVVPCSLCGLY